MENWQQETGKALAKRLRSPVVLVSWYGKLCLIERDAEDRTDDDIVLDSG